MPTKQRESIKHKIFCPCLMDRLLDDEPKAESEVWDKFHFNAKKIRQVVKKNIEDILNNINCQEQLEPHRHSAVASSSLNFGVSPLAGKFATPHNHSTLAHRVREALIRFEPRLIPDSIVIRQAGTSQSVTHYGLLRFEIRGLIFWEGEAIDLCLGASYDTEASSATLTLSP